MIRRLTLLAALALPSGALAQSWECTYNRYCAEERACGPSDLVLKIRPQEGATDIDAYEIETGGRVLPARRIDDPSREARAFISTMEFNSIHLVSIFKNKSSRYTSHTPVARAQSQNFIGSCAEAF